MKGSDTSPQARDLCVIYEQIFLLNTYTLLKKIKTANRINKHVLFFVLGAVLFSSLIKIAFAVFLQTHNTVVESTHPFDLVILFLT